MARGTLRVGTSGYSYPEWKGAFYPEDLAASEFLPYYAARFHTVEINNTFYRFPAESLLAGWRDATPDVFCFAVKANQGITHRARLKDADDLTRDFVERCRTLGAKLGPILFQLPPSLRRDDDRLALFLAGLPPDLRYAVEFRNESWFDDAIFQTLRDSEVALCIAEGETIETPPVATAGFAYLRLRKESYEVQELARWRAWIDERLAQGLDVFAYLKHDEAGVSPEVALRLLDEGVAARAPGGRAHRSARPAAQKGRPQKKPP
jgi:uncharacterized protein YecE (DUF72 family)